MRLHHAGIAVLAAACAIGACARSESTDAATEIPTLDVTSWTDKTELFMEYPPLVAGRPALFAIHLTKLADFTAVSAGRASLEFTPESGGSPQRLTGPSPSRPGVFRVEEPPPMAGRYRWALVLEAPGLSDRHDLGAITVFTDERSAIASAGGGAEDPAAIAYLKEQQWTNPFATNLVTEAEVRTSVRAPATVHPLPGGEAIVAAPAAGRLRADQLLSIGDRVKPGQILAFLEPRLAAGVDRATLAADVAEAKAAHDAAQIEQARAERLLEEKPYPLGAWKMRVVRRRLPNRGCGPRKHASSSVTRRCGRAAAQRRETRLRCAPRLPAVSPKCRPHLAPPTTKALRSSGS